LGRLLDHPKLLPPGCQAQRANAKDVFWQQPGVPPVAVTTDPDFFEEHSDSLEFWTPGNPAFPGPQESSTELGSATSLDELLRS
jgi:hypothetical protein